MNKKNKIRVGMPFIFNHDGIDIVGTVTKVKETASGLEFSVEPFEKFKALNSVYGSSKMFKDAIENYPHPDGNPKACDFMIRDESLELHCEVCNKYFKPVNGLHYIAKTMTAVFMGPDVENFHDAYDCPRCGSQILAKERAPEAK